MPNVELLLVGIALCHSEDCDVLTWDPFASAWENFQNAGEVVTASDEDAEPPAAPTVPSSSN